MNKVFLAFVFVHVLLFGYAMPVRICAVDEDGIPVSNRLAWVTFRGWPKSRVAEGRTDEHGVFVARGHVNDYVMCGFDDEDGKWYVTQLQYYEDMAGSVLTGVVKRVGRQMPKKEKFIRGILPMDVRECGYDLLMGDWVTPSGKGQVSDMVIRFEGTFDAEQVQGTYKGTVSFTSNAMGFIRCRDSLGCVMKEWLSAPECNDHRYESRVSFYEDWSREGVKRGASTRLKGNEHLVFYLKREDKTYYGVMRNIVGGPMSGGTRNKFSAWYRINVNAEETSLE